MRLDRTPKRLVLSVLLAFAAGACGGSGAKGGEAQFPSSGSAPYSGSVGPYPPSSPGVPARETITAGIVVRPDRICVPFAIRVLESDPERAVAIARGVASEIGQALAGAAGSAGAVRMRGIAVAPAYPQQQKAASEATGFALVADGSFDVPLVASADFWARSRLLAALVAVSKQESDKRATSGAKVAFEPPRFEVEDPEVHRPALTKAWSARAHAFAEAAQTKGAPLSLVDCAIPGEIVQRHVSTEEVALTLAIACRLDARTTAPPG